LALVCLQKVRDSHTWNRSDISERAVFYAPSYHCFSSLYRLARGDFRLLSCIPSRGNLVLVLSHLSFAFAELYQSRDRRFCPVNYCLENNL